MEVAVGRSGGESVTREPTDEERSRIRLNIGLYAATVVLACVAVLLAFVVYQQDSDWRFWDGKDSSRVELAPGAGTDVGRGTVVAVPEADDADQLRVAAQLEAAASMVRAFSNFDFQDPDESIEAVRSMSTGDFLKQYNSGAADLKKLATEAQSTMVAKVVWAGLVAGDEDSATVILTTTGSVTNKTTEFKKEARNYRVQIELVLEDDRWLTRDLQYVT